MVRTQIQLTEEESEALKTEARRRGVSVAELIRQCVDRFIEESSVAAAQPPSRMDALKVIGMFSSGLSDISARHDDYFVEAILGDQET